MRDKCLQHSFESINHLSAFTSGQSLESGVTGRANSTKQALDSVANLIKLADDSVAGTTATTRADLLERVETLNVKAQVRTLA